MEDLEKIERSLEEAERCLDRAKRSLKASAFCFILTLISAALTAAVIVIN